MAFEPRGPPCDCASGLVRRMKAERRAAAAGLRPQQQAPEAKAGVGLVFKVRLCCAGPHALLPCPSPAV